METIIKQSADGLILSRDNNFDTNLGKVFINNHEITDIDTFFKVAEENTRLLEQCKNQKEVINKAIELLGNYKHYSTPDEKQNSENEDLVNNAFDILKEVE